MRWEIPIYWNEAFQSPIFSRNLRQLYASYRTGKEFICLSGMRSCGKTTGIWPWIFYWCLAIKDFQVIIARKEYATLVNSTLKSLNKHILKYPFYDEKHNPWVLDGGMHRPREFIFQNGSRIWLMGLRDPEQLKGMEPDIFWHNEVSREYSRKGWTLLGGSQAEGRGVWKRGDESFKQIIADTNPDAPQHWVYKYFHDKDQGDKVKQLWLDFQLVDNPAYSDDGVNLNKTGLKALEDLLATHPPGLDRDRYVYGKWVAAEGAVLHNFDFRKDVISELPDMSSSRWLHYRGIDFGDDDPTICLWSSLNKDNGLLISHREWRKSRTELEEHAEAIHEHSREQKYEWTVADSAHAMERRTLRKLGIATIGSPKDLKENFRLMRMRIGQGNWKIFEHGLIEKDHHLIQGERCVSILDEIGKLKYPEKKTGSPSDDLPDKKCERHAVDAAQYTIAKLDKYGDDEVEKEPIDWTPTRINF